MGKPKRIPERLQLEYLFAEGVGVAGPEDRGPSLSGSRPRALGWPEGWWGVWDEDNGFIAYFQNEEDAYAFRLLLITIRQQGEQIATRYKKRKK